MLPSEGYRQLAGAFQRLEIEFFIGGSIASSYHSIPRASLDIDIVAAIKPEQANPLVAALGPGFYADADMIRKAILRKRAFNLIHTDTSYKFDIFPKLEDEFHQLQFSRRCAADLGQSGLSHSAYIATAEDMILEKLNWYRLGGGVSERQWNDILSLLEIQKSRLDLEYLDRWAEFLKVGDLLARARSEDMQQFGK